MDSRKQISDLLTNYKNLIYLEDKNIIIGIYI
ncbi:hypothetical protein SAMN05443549_10477 [Flavobacterium fluvii]|uniref:Uncharacterized protein n=1 Tax=Flavobacterium fluvii TaxID=468056 RepID=A0A1M5JUX0_9FLAO|nr:hypothetical protein SAMN05443549_10477 [Flavobacterium fluvii]